MLRPRKKYTVHDLRKLKGKRCQTHVHVKTPEAEEANMLEMDVNILNELQNELS